LGMFDTLPALMVATSVDEIYNTVLIESPLAPYFRGCFSADDLDEVHIELIRNHLWKAYLEDFNFYIQTDTDSINSETRTLMTRILNFEADRRIVNIAINACGSERLSKEERYKLFPRFGSLWDAGISKKLAFVDDLDQIRGLLDPIPAFRGLLNDYLSAGGKNAKSTNNNNNNLSGGSSTTSYELPRGNNNNTTAFGEEPRTLEEHFFDHEVDLCKEAFDHQFTFAIFYSWSRLKEQEIRNLIWIAECINQGQRQNIHNYISIF
jgi:V-type H+-transporting ATPase subunit d